MEFGVHIVVWDILSLQEEFQLAIFKNKKKENIFATRVLYTYPAFALLLVVWLMFLASICE